MALDFPNAPTNGQQFTGPSGELWQFDGVKWFVLGAGATLPITGGTLSGPLILAADPTVALGAVTKQYADAGSAAAEHNVGRNLLHNGLMNVAQRGTGPWTTHASFTADRWQLALSVSTCNVNIVAISDAIRSQIGDEAATSFLSAAVTGTAGAGDYSLIMQHIENVRRLAGKTVTVSFWAQATAALRLGVGLSQVFGTGGSPSPGVSLNGQAVTLSTAWARYSVTAALPSTAGMTLGTNGDSYTNLSLWLTAGSNFVAASGSVGVQSGTFGIWGVQLEVGSVATPLEKLDPRVDLANCQRFYETGVFFLGGSSAAAGSGCGYSQTFAVAKRAPPTMTPSGTTVVNVNSTTINPNGTESFGPYAVTGAAGGYQWAGNFTASADL